jgi:hypothetical protein
VEFSFSAEGEDAKVVGYQPGEGRVDVTLKKEGRVRVRVPSWVNRASVRATVDARDTQWRMEGRYVCVDAAAAGSRVSVRYPMRELEQEVMAGQERFRVRWKGDVVVGVDPPGKREPTYRERLV